MEKKLYAVGCYTSEDWQYIHEILTRDGTLEDNIPNEHIECADLKEHSETRAVYLLSESEAEELLNHPRVQFVHIDYSSYPEQFKPPPEELKTLYRYDEPEKQYRNWNDTSILPVTPDSTDINRGGYQLLRCSQKEDPWYGLPATTVINDRVSYEGDGSNVDVIVGDEGCWIGHSEFQNNTGNGPTAYVGGNVLPGNGTCDILDVVLDAPYYIDPAWFNADAANRLITRWDGTIVPIESVARDWWGNSSQRSSQFASIGAVSINSLYTRAACLGSNTARPTINTTHGTQCAANAFGRTQGWAFNANKWVINVYGYNSIGFEEYFTIMKLFHLHKPINLFYGTKDPTISSNSWGYRSPSHRTNGFYFYRQGASGGTGVSYLSTNLPNFMRYVGVYGDANRMKGEMLDNAFTVAGKEMIDAGVIFVGAAGNSNQKQVGPTHPDFNNYWSTTAQGSNVGLSSATHLEFGITCYNTTNRRGFPQQLGKYTDPETGLVVYPTINIGALDDSYTVGGLERKVNYSDMGNQIDCYAPADGTLTAVNAISGRLRPDTYTVSGPLPEPDDTGFTAIASASAQLNGTSSFAAVPNTGQRITTDGSGGTVTGITTGLSGSSGLTDSTTPTSGDNDDGYWSLSLPFPISFNGIIYTTIFVGTNTYITFGSGSSVYEGLSRSNPALPKIMMSCADNSCQRVYYGSSGSAPNRTYHIRYEGTAAVTGILGAPNMVYEATFYESTPNQIDIQIGDNYRYVSNSGAFTLFYDAKFSGTSSACPVATGLIATKLQYNRNWTWQDVRNWLQNQVGDANTNQFFTGVESTSANDSNWANVNSLEGGRPLVIWDSPVLLPPDPAPEVLESSVVKFASGSGLKFKGVKILYKS